MATSLVLLTIVLAIAKDENVIHISWFWVLAPIWVPILTQGLILILSTIVAVFQVSGEERGTTDE